MSDKLLFSILRQCNDRCQLILQLKQNIGEHKVYCKTFGKYDHFVLLGKILSNYEKANITQNNVLVFIVDFVRQCIFLTWTRHELYYMCNHIYCAMYNRCQLLLHQKQSVGWHNVYSKLGHCVGRGKILPNNKT